MKRRNCLLSLVMALLLGVGLSTFAQEATTNPSAEEPRSTSRVRVPSPYNLLGDLSEDQQSKIKDIHAEMLDEQRALRQKEKEEIEAVLTDDQKKELEDLVAKATIEKKAAAEERRAKVDAEKANTLKDKADLGASTQPSGGQ